MPPDNPTPQTDQSTIGIDISIPCAAWSDALENVENLCRQAVQKTVIAKLSQPAVLKSSVEISLVLSDDDFIQNLNRQYRKIDRPTNVLAFPGDDVAQVLNEDADDSAPLLLGDVVIAYETSVAEALEQNKKLSDHLCHLVVHGTLHLLGYDHEDETEAIKMEALEIQLLAEMGVANPYEDL